MKARLSALFLSLALAVSPLSFAQQAPAAKGGSEQTQAQVTQPPGAGAATEGAHAALGPLGILLVVAAVVAAIAVAANQDDDTITATATR
jgi:hypothetical protein